MTNYNTKSGLTLEDITNYAKVFLSVNYGLDLKIPIKIDGRIGKKLGVFHARLYRSGLKEARRVVLHRDMFETASREGVLDILRHEIIHYAMFELGLPYKDGEEHFENELKKHNTVSQKNILEKYGQREDLGVKRFKVHHYSCNCGTVHRTTRKFNLQKKNYTCTICKQTISYSHSEEKSRRVV